MFTLFVCEIYTSYVLDFEKNHGKKGENIWTRGESED